MTGIAQNLRTLKDEIKDFSCTIVVVTKTHSIEKLQEAYDLGLRIFGENKVQELVSKFEVLPKDIEWHMIGHLQSNKVKYIAPFVHLIHSVDSLGLLVEINKQAQKNNRTISCLLQVHIAQEETKYGLSFQEVDELIASDTFHRLQNVKIEGLMGMSTNTSDESVIRAEFKSLKTFFDDRRKNQAPVDAWTTLSMGMSGDYFIALQEGSTMIRIGSALFGARNYAQ